MSQLHGSERGMRRRILLVANTAWYLRNFRARLVERLEMEGYEVVLAAPPDDEIADIFFRRRPFVPLRLSRKGRNPFGEILALLRLMRLIRLTRPAIVLTWTPKPNTYGALVGRLLRVPVIPNVSGLGAVFIRGGLLVHVVGALYRQAFARAPAVFFQNQEDYEAFVGAGWVDAAKAQRLPGSGVDLQRFQPAPMPATGAFVFLYVGRLLADKGVRELIEAARQLRDRGYGFVLRLVGFIDAGNPAAISQHELNSWIEGGDVDYLGPLKDVRPALAAAHCVVLPSYREGMPRSLLEAGAVARPIVTTNAPGCRDAVSPERSGFLCTPKSASSLADCMQRMLALSPAALAEMGRAGRVHVERYFSEEIVLDAYLRECEKVTHRKPVLAPALEAND